MKIYAYLRVSSEGQAESGLGLEAQLKACQEFAKKQGVELSGVFRDEGLSGALPLDKRQGLYEAISSLEKGDFLLVAKRDRISRDVDSLAFIQTAVHKKKASIISADGQGNGDTPSDILMRRMLDAFAEHERLLIKARTKSALNVKKCRNERVGYIPFGYKLCDDKLHLEKDEKEQTILNEMKELRKQGLSLREIANELNKGDNLTRSRKVWNHVSVNRILMKNAA